MTCIPLLLGFTRATRSILLEHGLFISLGSGQSRRRSASPNLDYRLRTLNRLLMNANQPRSMVSSISTSDLHLKIPVTHYMPHQFMDLKINTHRYDRAGALPLTQRSARRHSCGCWICHYAEMSALMGAAMHNIVCHALQRSSCALLWRVPTGDGLKYRSYGILKHLGNAYNVGGPLVSAPRSGTMITLVGAACTAAMGFTGWRDLRYPHPGSSEIIHGRRAETRPRPSP